MPAPVLHNQVEIPTLTTERLTLRAPAWADFEAYAAFRGDAEQTKFLGGPFSRTQAFSQMAELIGHWSLRGYGRWVLADKTTDKPLGVVGLFYPEGWPEPEIAWSLFPGSEGRGLAMEAALAARAYAYDTLGWTTVISLIAEDNTRSAALAQRMGATPDGSFVAPVGEGADSIIWRHPGPDALREGAAK